MLPLDAATATLAAVLALALRGDVGDRGVYLLAIPLLVAAWFGVLAVADAYGRHRLSIVGEQFRSVGRAGVIVVAVVAVVAYVTGFGPHHLELLAVVAVLMSGALATRALLGRWLRGQRARGRLQQRTVVVGRADSAQALVRSLRKDDSQGLMPVAVCATDLEGRHLGHGQIDGVPVVGAPADAIDAVDLVDAEVLAVASHPDLAGAALRRLAWALEDRGVDLIVAPGLLDVAGPRLSIRPSLDLSLLHVERPSAAKVHVAAKSIMDRCLAAVLLLLLSPLLIVIALAVRLGDRGPVLFRQERVGVRGERFRMYKFRSMVPNAETRLAALLPESEGNGVLFKMKSDPRVTRVGRILRRFSLDELPQLFNVLVGDMSLVGPRPPLPHEVAQYEPDALSRLRVKPGMTGLWQVSGRSDLSWEESLKLDLHYVDNWSPWGDSIILLRTIGAVVKAPGAY